MTVIDRRYSVAEGTAVKAPCRVATTANIVLSGLQTLDGVTLVEHDRVLVKNQTTGAENGIYEASSGNWLRAKDFDGAYDVVTGTRVFVTSGTANFNTEWSVSTTGTITIDTTSIAFQLITSLGTPFADGTVAAPGAAFFSSPSWGFYKTASGIGMSVAGVLVFEVKPGAFISTSMLTNANVTYAKIQNVAASRLLGNPTGSAAPPSEISVGSGLTLSGTSLTADLSASLVPDYISGLTLSTAGSSSTMSIAAGVANDSTNANLMRLSSAISKTTSAWAVGTGNGGLDTGAIANSTWYHFYQIKRVDTGVVDVIFSSSPSVPTLPTNYTLYRRIGSAKTNGSAQWTSFTQTGDTFIWSAMVADASNVSSTTSRVSKVLTVPTGIVVKALFRASINASVSGTVTLFTSLQESDQAAATGTGDLSAALNAIAAGNFSVFTDTSAQIGVRSSTAGGAGYYISTYGWIDARGKR